MRPSPVLLLIATAAVAVRTPGERNESFTTTWTDSSKVGDTTFYGRGRVITTVSINTDSIWSARPPAHGPLDHRF